MFQEIVLSSKEDFGRICKELRENFSFEELWFRGQRNSAWGLVPSIGRLNVRLNYRQLYAAWRDKISLIEGLDEYEGWAFAQHYGLATHLLDWSVDENVALFFATQGLSECEDLSNPAVYIYARSCESNWSPLQISAHADSLDGKILDSNNEVISENVNELVFLPNGFENIANESGIGCFSLNEKAVDRLALQKGRFTVHVPANLCLKEFEANRKGDLLFKLEIPVDIAKELAETIELSHESLFGNRDTREIDSVNELFRELLSKMASGD